MTRTVAAPSGARSSGVLARSILATTAATALAALCLVGSAPGASAAPLREALDEPSAARTQPEPEAAESSAPGAGTAKTRTAEVEAAVVDEAPAAPETAAADDTATAWSVSDSPDMDAERAAYLIAGTLYGDPQGNTVDGVITIDSDGGTHYRRELKGAPESPLVHQFGDAAKAWGGDAKYSNPNDNAERVIIAAPDGVRVRVDVPNGEVTINGYDAFALSRDNGEWTTTATGPQVRAFLAGVMQGEGNVNGKVLDDRSEEHLLLVQRLLATTKAYEVPTDVSGGSFQSLTIEDDSYFERVQSYPFITFSRCPGGTP